MFRAPGILPPLLILVLQTCRSEQVRQNSHHRLCDEGLLNEGLVAMADLGCVKDVKRCLQAGACPAAGISKQRLCKCYQLVRLPLQGRRRADYNCHPTHHARDTILQEWEECQTFSADREL